MNIKRRVVVTGIGAVTPLASNAEASWDKIINSQSGIGNITLFDVTDSVCKIAGEVKFGDGADLFNPDIYIDQKEQKKMDRFIHFAIAGAEQAIFDSGWKVQNEQQAYRTGVMIGSGIGGLPSIQKTSIPKSVQRKVDKINQNIIKTNDSLIQTQKDLDAQTAYSPAQPSSNIIDRASINAISNKFNKLKQQQFKFDVKWDQIKESRLTKRVNNLEDESDNLQDKLSDTLQNRLLKLWNKFGLNLSSESPISNSSTLLSALLTRNN